MGQPVVHFEVVGKDAVALRSYYEALFGWEFSDPMGPMDYALVQREGNTNADGMGIAGGVGGGMEEGHVTFYVEVPEVEAGMAKAESLGGKRVHGPIQVPGTDIMLGHFTDPEGHLIGLVNA